jgi:hypothetical protein
MQNQKFISSSFQKFFTLILITGFLSGAFHVAAQTKRTTKKTSDVKTTTPVKSAKEEKVDLEGLIPPDKSKTMSAAFKNGALPAFAALPSGNIEEQAAQLAEMVAAGDENSTAALMTAFKTAGYGLRDAQGNVSFNQENWQGIALDEGEIASISKLYGNGYGIGLGRFGDGLAILAPQWKKETNVRDVVESIRNASFSPNQSVRFWANFIIEMGRHAQVPFDLRNDEDIKHARLDAVQLALILSRLAADLNFQAKNPTRQAQIEQPKQDYFVKASYRNDLDIQRTSLKTANFTHNRAANLTADAPCPADELESLALDLHATGAGIVFGEFLKHIEDKKLIPKTPGQLLGAANAALIVLKLIMTYAALDAEIKMDGDYLTRTKTTEDGERKALTAKVKMDIGKWQITNCIRSLLNRVGLDFSLPSDGAVGGVRVDWNLVEGGQTGSVIRQIRNSGTQNSDALVYLDTLAFAEAEDKKKYYNYTDDKGESKIYVVGMRQKTDLSKQLLNPVMKTMAVNLDIQVKSMKIKNAVAATGTANDLAGSALAFWNNDIPGFVAGTAAETIYRSNLGSSKVHAFPVRDWIPCDGAWRGTITYKRVFFNKADAERRDEGSKKSFKLNIDRDLYFAKFTINAGANPRELKAVSNMAYRRNTYSYSKIEKYTECRGFKGMWSQTGLDTFKAIADGEDKNASVSINISGNSGNLQFHLPRISGDSELHYTTNYQGGCAVFEPVDRLQKNEINIDGGNFGVDKLNMFRILLPKQWLKGNLTVSIFSDYANEQAKKASLN